MINDITENQSKELNKFIGEGNFWSALDFLKKIDKEKKVLMIDWYLGHTYYRLHQYIKAAKHVEIFISKKKEDILNLNFLGEIYYEQGKYDKAMSIFEKALLLDKKNKSTILNLARLNLNIGDVSKSENYYNSLLNIEPDNLSYDYSLLRIDKKYLSETLIKKIDLYSQKNTNNQIFSYLILAKKNEIDKNFDLEVENLFNAHKLYLSGKQKAYQQQYNYSTNLLPNFINTLEKINLGSDNNFCPIFIMGLPRSGTTLIERIIVSSANKIQSLGEADVFDKVFYSNEIIKNQKNIFSKNPNFLLNKILEQYKEQGLKNDNMMFTDKSISNFLYIDLIIKIFPNAKFIYCRRDPLANIIGIFKSFLPNVYWTHSIQDVFFMTQLYLDKLEKIYEERNKNFHLISLEKLTNNPQDVSAELFKFLNLKWSNKNLENMNSNFVIKTASNLQEREKIKKHDLQYTKIYSKIFKKLNFKNHWLI